MIRALSELKNGMRFVSLSLAALLAAAPMLAEAQDNPAAPQAVLVQGARAQAVPAARGPRPDLPHDRVMQAGLRGRQRGRLPATAAPVLAAFPGGRVPAASEAPIPAASEALARAASTAAVGGAATTAGGAADTAIAGAGVAPICGSSTISCCSGGSTTASDTIASSTTAVIPHMSA